MAPRVRNRVRGFDQDTFGKFTRSLQLALMDGNLARAHHLVDQAATKFRTVARPLLELGDSVAQLVDPETAGLLQNAGFHSIASVFYASDAELLDIRMFGHGRLAKTRAALIEHRFAARNSQTAVLSAG